MIDMNEVKHAETKDSEECCPEFHPIKWDGKLHDWKKKRFVKTSMPTFFHMPLPSMIGKKVTKLFTAAQQVHALLPEMDENLLLFYDPHAFKSEMYMAVEKEVPALENTFISGKFISKVYDGPYREIPNYFKEMEKYLTSIDRKGKSFYVHYAYCPKCSRKYGHNYMVIFAKVEE